MIDIREIAGWLENTRGRIKSLDIYEVAHGSEYVVKFKWVNEEEVEVEFSVNFPGSGKETFIRFVGRLGNQLGDAMKSDADLSEGSA